MLASGYRPSSHCYQSIGSVHIHNLLPDAVAFSVAHFGAGIGSIFLDGVSCGGNEDSLIDCTRALSVICSNGHNEDAGVRCQVEGLLLHVHVHYKMIMIKNR